MTDTALGAKRQAWRLLLGVGDGLCEADGSSNMAVDAALLASVREGGAPVVRFYRWAPACLSFGRNQPAAGLYDRHRAAARRIDFVRRPTGGQAVLHDDEITYAVVAPVAVLGRPRDAYRRINEALMVGLRALGVGAEVAGPAVAVPAAGGAAGAGLDWAAACFRRPESGEVVAGGRKLVGSAQRTEGRTILQHGSLLLGGSQAAAEELLVGRGPELGGAMPAVWTTLEAELGERPPDHVLIAALTRGFEGLTGTSLAPAGLNEGEVLAARRLRERFASEAWTWRR
jgi:lipoyl(octanoyl) transferase